MYQFSNELQITIDMSNAWRAMSMFEMFDIS